MTEFRTAVPCDAQAIVDLANAAYRGEGSKRGWTTEADLLGGQRTDQEQVLEKISAPDSRIDLVFSAEGTLVGCVHLKKEPQRTCYLGMLTVDPGCQSAGLGKQLLAHSEDVARGWACRRLRITVIAARSELLRFYERRGFRLTGKTEPFPEHDPRFGIPKVRGLRFLELVKELA